jgi:hypothetical protein
MRRSLILGALAVLVSFEAASAGTLVKEYYDVRRTGGHKRSEAEFRADLRYCAVKTGVPYDKRRRDTAISGEDPPAFKACMATRGLQFQYSHYKHNERHWQARSSGGSYEPPTDYGSPPPVNIEVIPPAVANDPPLSPTEYPGYYEHRDDQPPN